MCLCLAIIEFLELERGKTKEIEKTVQEGSRITFSPFMTECQWLGNNDSKQRPEVWGGREVAGYVLADHHSAERHTGAGKQRQSLRGQQNGGLIC